MNSILLNTLKGEASNRPPVWFMRQAGRILPSYLKIKENYTFWQMMKNPEIAAKVTLLPIDDLGVDGAILFSDILVIPHAMGMGLDFTNQGPVFEHPLAFRDNPLSHLNPDPSRLEYIYDVCDEIIKTRPDNIPLIGFCGAPLTVLLYMLQGLGRKGEFPDACKFMYANPDITQKLVDTITELSITYALGQIDHGAQIFQLFDTHAGLIPWDLYKRYFLPATQKIYTAIRERNVPFIYFPKGIGIGIQEITPEVCDYLSVDWQTPLPLARQLVHSQIGLQGNVDPRLLYASIPEMKKQLEPLVEFGRENHNWVFNLGHGFMPGLDFDKAKFLTEWVKQVDWKR